MNPNNTDVKKRLQILKILFPCSDYVHVPKLYRLRTQPNDCTILLLNYIVIAFSILIYDINIYVKYIRARVNIKYKIIRRQLSSCAIRVASNPKLEKIHIVIFSIENGKVKGDKRRVQFERSITHRDTYGPTDRAISERMRFSQAR